MIFNNCGVMEEKAREDPSTSRRRIFTKMKKGGNGFGFREKVKTRRGTRTQEITVRDPEQSSTGRGNRGKGSTGREKNGR